MPSKAGDQCIGLLPGMLVAAADRAGLAGHQCRAQRLDILAARQTLALEHGKGDRERLLGGISEPSLYGIHLRYKRIYP